MLVALLTCAPRPVATAPVVTPIEAAWAPESADARVGEGLSNVVAAIVGRYPIDGTWLRRGDFVQMWSAGGGGHSAVFDRWERDGDTIVGVRYWSTHPMLAGVGCYTDPFGTYGLDREKFYGARLAGVEQWVASAR